MKIIKIYNKTTFVDNAQKINIIIVHNKIKKVLKNLEIGAIISPR